MVRIFVDSDGCPVVKIAVDLAKEFKVPITLVKNYSHLISDDYAEVVTVDNSSDSADFYIANHISKGDIVVTQDNGLAAMCLGKKATVLNQNGLLIDDSNIEGMLSSRHINKELRNRGVYASKSKKRDSSKDRDFESSLRAVLQRSSVENHLNCCQKVILSFAKGADLDKEIAVRVGAGFGSGACSGELCGAVSGAVMVLGLMYSEGESPSVKDTVTAFQGKFKEKYGSLRCKEILGYDFSIPGEKDRAIEDGAISENCPGIIEGAKSLLAQTIEESK